MSRAALYFLKKSRVFAFILPLLLLPVLTWSLWPKESGNSLVHVRISWNYVELDTKMKIYEPAGQTPLELWQTASVPSIKEAPVSVEIDESKLVLKPGEKKRFVLAMENPGKEPVYFFAAPHIVQPDYLAFGFKFKCLCVNHAFEIPPGGVWYRVVELRLSEDFIGDQIEITHSLVSLTEERVRSMQQ